MEMKRCHCCGKYKPLSDFWRNRSCKDGLQSSCKECLNKRRKELNEKRNPKGDKSISEKKHSKQIFGKEFRRNEDLERFTDKQLLYEIRNRGYHGVLEYSEKIEI